MLGGYIELTTPPRPGATQPELIPTPEHSDIGPHMAYAVQWWLFTAGVPDRLGGSGTPGEARTHHDRSARRQRRARRPVAAFDVAAVPGKATTRVPGRIEDYALIGDLQTAALVGRDGSIDWLCLPRFDSAACFAALLGDDDNGHWRIAPAERRRLHQPRATVGDTLVLESVWETRTGTVRVTDFMPQRGTRPRRRAHRGGRLRPVDDAQRAAAALRLRPRRAVGAPHRRPPRRRRRARTPSGCAPSHRCTTYGQRLRTHADFTVAAGEQVAFVLTWHPSHEPRPAPVDPYEALAARAWRDWHEWSARCTLRRARTGTPCVRSLITLKALTYAPTGGIVAAPDHLAARGDRRRTQLGLPLLLAARRHAHPAARCSPAATSRRRAAWRDWLLRAVAGDPADLQIMYGAGGRAAAAGDTSCRGCAGYEGSAPVRVGNARRRPAPARRLRRGHRLACTWPATAGLADEVARLEPAAEPDRTSWSPRWHEPDEGLWEVRGPRRHFVHSKVMAWVAADRAVAPWRRSPALERDRGTLAARCATRSTGTCATRATTRSATRSPSRTAPRTLDAAPLLIPQVGFLPPDDPRVVGTVEAVQRSWPSTASSGATAPTDGAVDGLPGGEGAFLACSFWLADALALTGRVERGRATVRAAAGPAQRRRAARRGVRPGGPAASSGNFPQAFSHVGLVNTALALTRSTAPRAEDAG